MKRLVEVSMHVPFSMEIEISDELFEVSKCANSDIEKYREMLPKVYNEITALEKVAETAFVEKYPNMDNLSYELVGVYDSDTRIPFYET